MYVQGFHAIFASPAAYLALATFFVILSQIKINVTNAYSGSLSWSNFFARFLHVHPGRVVWLLLNVGIALTLMELGVFSTLLWVLGFYSNVAIAWIGAVVADLVINKPLGLSPNYIEFKRAHLYNFNPVGFGSMLIASAISVAAFFGLFGPTAQAFSTLIALGIAMSSLRSSPLRRKGSTISLERTRVRCYRGANSLRVRNASSRSSVSIWHTAPSTLERSARSAAVSTRRVTTTARWSQRKAQRSRSSESEKLHEATPPTPDTCALGEVRCQCTNLSVLHAAHSSFDARSVLGRTSPVRDVASTRGVSLRRRCSIALPRRFVVH